MRKETWNLIYFDRKIFISTVRKNSEHTCVILLDNFNRLFPIMDSSYSSKSKFLLDCWFVLHIGDVRKLDWLCRVEFCRDLVPDEGEAVFAHASDLVHHFAEVFFCNLSFTPTIIQDAGQLKQLIRLQCPNIYQIDPSSAVLKLLLAVAHVVVQLFDGLVAKCLTNCLDQRWKVHGEAWPVLIKLSGVLKWNQLVHQEHCNEAAPFNFVADCSIRACLIIENGAQFFLVMYFHIVFVYAFRANHGSLGTHIRTSSPSA